ncbi:MAG: phospholipase C, phosphocholine-specific [Phycisphaerae bacterium]
MHQTRRDFLRTLAALTGAGSLAPLGASIARAVAIAPPEGTSFLDAEHVVILMQENRSFDHAFGTLRGVRGFDDPRAMRLPDGCPVWAQADASGRRFLPFRLDLKGSRATWMGSLPHSWTDQVDALRGGMNDHWLVAKLAGEKAYASMPLTMGHYTREDIPFYHALADAFTVCDQHFCSTLTGTTPNRLHLWTGTIRARQHADAKANTLNSDVDYGRWADWTTFPERLEDLGVSWRVYQNELSIASGLTGEHDAWLSNFTDNPLEWFSQYGVRFAKVRREHVARRLEALPGEIAAARASAGAAKTLAALERERRDLEAERAELDGRTPDARMRRLHERAFGTNAADAAYRDLIDFAYDDEGIRRTLKAPKVDPLMQFRRDAASGSLPTVSWLVPSERLSDHPGSAWFGAWYLAEALDILTADPSLWRKTIFILTYDENDGYFDHVPPFMAPDPRRTDGGKVSKGIDASLEFVTLEQDRAWHPKDARESAIGLGYRVPMVVASPWSRGGAVCSQVFDHTSVLRLLERVVGARTRRELRETNINAWRRTVCGDLSSAFGSPAAEPPSLPPPDRDAVLSAIDRARFRDLPSGFRPLTDDEVRSLREGRPPAGLMPRQEPGTRPACPLPYELAVEGGFDASRMSVRLRLAAGCDLFGDAAAGGAFIARDYAPDGSFTCRHYAVTPGDSLEDEWNVGKDRPYRIEVVGPNGFLREFRGDMNDPDLRCVVVPPLRDRPAESIAVRVTGDAARIPLRIEDHGYGGGVRSIDLDVPGLVEVPVAAAFGWYDFSLSARDGAYSRRFAGRVESGVWTRSDPRIGASGEGAGTA